MKTKTLLELVTLSTTLYALSKETNIIEKLADAAEKGKEKINDFARSKVTDEDGNEVEFLEKLSIKAGEVRDEIEAKIAELVASFYDKVNIAHTDKIRMLEEQIKDLRKDLSLAEAKINKMDKKAD